MARLHSGLGDRTVYTTAGLARAQGLPATVYEDPAGTVLANLAVYDPTAAAVPGAVIPGAALVVDAFSNRPAFWDLADREVLYITVNGGPLEPIRPDAQPQVTALATRVGTVEGVADSVTLARRYPAASDAAIRAAAQALAAAGGGVVMLPAATITLASPLPLLEGVTYCGVPPVLQALNEGAGYMPDAEVTFVGGTVFVGDGTFDAFAANTTAQASAPVDWGTEQISGASIYGVGINGFRHGINAGATNRIGLVWGVIDEVYAINCTQWGVRLINFQHMNIGVIRVWDCNNGIYLGSDVPVATLIPGNSQAHELFVKVKYAPGGGINPYRGIVLGALDMVGADLGGVDVAKLQVNAFNRSESSVTATFTSGSANIAVPNGSIYAVGMPVQFTAAGSGVTANNIYVIRSIVGNNIQVALQAKSGSVVTASASGPLTMRTRGWPNVELYDLRSSRLHDVDVEGQSTVGVYAENVEQVDMYIATVPETALVELVGRNSPKCRWHNAYGGAKTDFDAASASQSQFHGPRNVTYGRLMQGLYEDVAAGTQGLSVSSGGQADQRPDLQVRAQGFLYPARSGVGEHVWVRDTSATLDGNNCGVVVVTGTSSPTFTLPTISTATVPGTSEVGMWFHICNTGTGTVTVTAAGGQNFNRNAAKTTLTVAAGQTLKVVACEDVAQMYWVAIPGTLA